MSCQSIVRIQILALDSYLIDERTLYSPRDGILVGNKAFRGVLLQMNEELPKVAFIGTGVMGKSMAQHVMNKGYQVMVFNRTRAKADPLVEAGAIWADTPAAAVKQADVVLTMVGFPSDVEEIYFGPQGMLAHAKAGTVFIDLTTSSPVLAERIAVQAKARGMRSLDAPVSGGDIGAREARLTIMVGGEEATFEEVLPILQCFGQNIILQGDAGAGQHTKMANQLKIASTMMGVCESLAYAQKAGLDPRRVLDSITVGAANSWSLSQLGPRMLDGDFAPGFYIKHFIKDLRIALDSAEELGLNLPGVKLAKSLYEELAAKGEEDRGTQFLFTWYTSQFQS